MSDPNRLSRAKVSNFLTELGDLLEKYEVGFEIIEEDGRGYGCPSFHINVEDQYGEGIQFGSTVDLEDVRDITNDRRIPEWVGNLTKEEI